MVRRVEDRDTAATITTRAGRGTPGEHRPGSRFPDHTARLVAELGQRATARARHRPHGG